MSVPPVDTDAGQTRDENREDSPREERERRRPRDETRGREGESASAEQAPPGRPSGRGRDRDQEGGRRERRFRRPRRKVCAFCVDRVTHLDYKDHARLSEFVSDRGKILKSRMTGTCSRHQRKLARAIKRARQIALLPFVAE